MGAGNGKRLKSSETDAGHASNRWLDQSSREMRDVMRGAPELMESNAFARASRGTAQLARLQRGAAGARMAVGHGPDELAWAERTPGAGLAARQLRRRAGGQAADLAWAEETKRALSTGGPEWALHAEHVCRRPERVRSLLQLSPDTRWLREVLEYAIERQHHGAVDMLLHDMPRRAPPSEGAAWLAVSGGDFGLAHEMLGRDRYRLPNMTDALAAVVRRGRRVRADETAEIAALPALLGRIMDVEPDLVRTTWAAGSAMSGIGRGWWTRRWMDPGAATAALAQHPEALIRLLVGAVNEALVAADQARAVAALREWIAVAPTQTLLAAHEWFGELSEGAGTAGVGIAGGLADLLHQHGWLAIAPEVLVCTSPTGWHRIPRAAIPELAVWAAGHE